MANISDAWAFDYAGPTSNSNVAGANVAENCAPSGINNAIRSLAGMLAQATSYQSAAISASVSTNIAATGTGIYQPVVGSGAINSFGSVAGQQTNAAVIRLLEFSSSASLSHGTSLILIGAASRKTQPGDVGGYIHEGTADVWREFLYSRANGGPAADSLSITTITNRSLSTSAVSTVTLNAASASITALAFTTINATTVNATSISASVGEFTLVTIGGHGTVAQVVRASSATYQSITTDLPVDNSIPQITEGEEVTSVAITPINASSTLRIRFMGNFGVSSASNIGAGLFVDATAAALRASGVRVTSASGTAPLVLEHALTAGSTSARTYRIRVGPDVGGAATVFVNGDNGSRLFGGVDAATLEIEEILPQ